jgi:hypothetical protein
MLGFMEGRTKSLGLAQRQEIEAEDADWHTI